MPLSQVSRGKKVTIKMIQAGRGLQARLASMGLIPGVEIRVMQNQPVGPFVIAFKGSRILLGRGMARKIYVE